MIAEEWGAALAGRCVTSCRRRRKCNLQPRTASERLRTSPSPCQPVAGVQVGGGVPINLSRIRHAILGPAARRGWRSHPRGVGGLHVLHDAGMLSPASDAGLHETCGPDRSGKLDLYHRAGWMGLQQRFSPLEMGNLSASEVR